MTFNENILAVKNLDGETIFYIRGKNNGTPYSVRQLMMSPSLLMGATFKFFDMNKVDEFESARQIYNNYLMLTEEALSDIQFDVIWGTTNNQW